MNTILVTGATGNVGRPLVTHLVDAGANVRAVTRNPDTAQLPAGVHVVTSAAARTARRVGGVPQLPRAGRGTRSVVRLARRAGVTRLVALSAINADDDFYRQPSGSAATATRKSSSSSSNPVWSG